MKKFIAKISIAIVLVFNINLQIASATFSDVDDNNKNYEAINYLQENGIINGYADGTFRPDQSVNRAEFLKIIIEGSNIPLNVAQDTPFADVNHDDWYGLYVKKAYGSGWINGYSDGTFKPDQTINKVEALKILAKAQGWDIPLSVTEKPFNDMLITAWYVPYISYAKNHGYLEETDFLFFPADPMTRANISEIIFRSIIDGQIVSISEEVNPDIVIEDDEDDEPTNANTPIATNFFQSITLDDELPSIFYANEVYLIEGNVNNSDIEKTTVILDGVSNSNYEIFTENTDNGSFSIPVYFKEAGEYNLGIVPGESGTSKAADITVISTLPENSATATVPSAPSTSVSFKDDQTFISFAPETKIIKRVHLSQGNKSVSYISRQDTGKIILNYSDFANFSEGNISYYMETAKLSSAFPLAISSEFKSGNSKTFSAVEHTFDLVKKNEISTQAPDTKDAPGTISFSGTVLTDIKLEALVIKPDGFVDNFDLTTAGSLSDYYGIEIIDAGKNFNFNYEAETFGRYILEINDKNGIPILNHPVYVGSGIPLLPDYFDLLQRKSFSGSLNLENSRQELINLINSSRTEHGLEPVEMVDELNNLAQDHSEDMATNNYFGHINLDEQTPNDRRLSAGISTGVSENLAKDTSVKNAHFGLMRSASHRENILTENWTRVGLGIALKDGHLYITEEFSTNNITDAELQGFKVELFNKINEERVKNSVQPLDYNLDLEQAGKTLNEHSINGTTLTNQIFSETLSENNISGSSEAIGRAFNLWPDILSSIIDDETTILSPLWELTGIDIQLNSENIINAMLILNEP